LTLVARKPFALIEAPHSLPLPNTDKDAHPPPSTVKVPTVGFVQLWPGVSTCATRHALPSPFSTVTVKRCVAVNPPGSSAVTVTVALPAATGVRVTALPDTLTLTVFEALDLAE